MNLFFSKHTFCAAVLGAAALALLPSCQDEDFGYTSADVRQEVYNRNFKEIFGDADPNHNWSMAQNVKVNINVPGARGYQVRVLTEVPTNRTSTILYDGIMTSDALSTSVDVIRGTRNLYVELKSAMGTRLVDGYYSINEEGMVDVNQFGTRAFSETAPACGVYHTFISRYNRVWNDAISSPSDADYRYDYGFQSNNPTYYLPVGTESKQVSPGWLIHCAQGEGGERTNGTDYDSGPRTFHLAHSKVENTDIAIVEALYFRNLNDQNHDAFNDAYVRYGDQGRRISIPDGDNIFHFALALRNKDNASDYDFKITIEKNEWDVWKEKITETVKVSGTTYNKGETNEGVVFKDAAVTLSGNNAGSGDYRITVQLISANQWVQALCGGFWIESNSNTPVVVEEVWGYLDYKDVRGGGIDRWKASNRILFENETKRFWWGGINTFAYRTFDVRKMVNAEGNTDVAQGTVGQFYIIDGEDADKVKVRTEEVKYSDMFPLYGMYKSTTTGQWKGSPFREGDNHVDPFFSDGNHKATDFEMPKSAQIVTCGACTDKNGAEHDGSVSIKMVGIGTGWSNDVGYFYYKADDESVYDEIDGVKVLDLNKVPKVIIRKDMQGALTGDQPNADQIDPSADGQKMPRWGLGFINYDRYVDGCYALSLADEERNELMNHLRDDAKNFVKAFENESQKKDIAINATFDAPIYKLPFYSTTTNQWNGVIPDANTATYIWPKGYVIGFFGIRTDANLGCELARVYTSDANVQRYYFNDIPRGATFSYKGKNYIGLEDELDYDNNDFLYEIEGVETIEPDITPKDDPVQVNEYQRWVVACEDLGGVWDYDFNDLVWDITKEMVYDELNGVKTLKGINLFFTPLAAGGTLEAVVQYNYNNFGEDWRDLGEIHNLVKRTPEKVNGAYVTPTNVQLNVDHDHNPTLQEIGERIKLGETIDPGLNGAVTISNILNHFRVVVENHNGEKYIVGNCMQGTPDHNHDSHNTGNGKTNAPQFLLLPCGWAWPAESVCITDVYSKVSDWAQEQTQTEWYWGWRNSTEGKNGAYIQNPLW